jgi:hypothetical protein
MVREETQELREYRVLQEWLVTLVPKEKMDKRETEV